MMNTRPEKMDEISNSLIDLMGFLSLFYFHAP